MFAGSARCPMLGGYPGWRLTEAQPRRGVMSPEERWPHLSLLAGHILYLSDSGEFQEIDRLELDRTERQLRDWIADVAGELDHAALKERIEVTRRYRYPEPPDASGLQAWHDYLFLFDRSEMLVEEVLSYPNEPSTSATRIRRFSRRRFAECGDEIRSLFPE
jgi:hypothetical protein